MAAAAATADAAASAAHIAAASIWRRMQRQILLRSIACRRGESLYNEEPRNLTNYEFSKVKVLHSELNPRRLEDMLPQYARSVLQKYQNLIELSNQELVDQGPIPIQPY